MSSPSNSNCSPGHRRDLVTERTRDINRLRALLTRIFPGLERSFDYSTLTGLAFITRFATPASITAATDEEIYDHLRGQGARRPTIPKLIRAARAAAGRQTDRQTGLLHERVTSDLACLRAVGKDVAVPKPYPEEFRDDVVRVARDRGEGVTIEQVANDFGVHPVTLHKWMRRADIDEGRSPGVTTRRVR